MPQKLNLGKVVGPAGSSGEGIAKGGTTDQILAKSSDKDYDTKWIDAPSGSSGENYIAGRDWIKVEELGLGGSSIIYENGMFIIIRASDDNYIFYSYDGIEWDKVQLPIVGDLDDITYGNGEFIAVGRNGLAVHSQNGISWQELTIPFPSSGIAFGDGKFVIIGNKKIAYSQSGYDWQEKNIDFNPGGRLFYEKDRFIACSNNYSGTNAIYSINGIDWIEIPDSERYSSVSYGNNKFILIPGPLSSSGNPIIYSTDGVNWERTPAPFNTFHGIVYGENKFVTISYDPYFKVAYSVDGTNWEDSVMPTFNQPYMDIAYGNGKFVATGWINGFAYSYTSNSSCHIPSGGTTNQVLAKKSNENYDVGWVDTQGSSVGKNLSGQIVKPTYNGGEVTAAIGAEIFNDYRDRVYNDIESSQYYGNIASGEYSHAEGRGTTASGKNSHAEGETTVASGDNSHAEGVMSIADGYWAHAEGYLASSTDIASHAEGYSNKSSGQGSHAEGISTVASGDGSHSEGSSTEAKGNYSHASGIGTIAHGGEFVIGVYNVDSQETDDVNFGLYPNVNTKFIVGSGDALTRSNIFRITTNGIYGSTQFTSSGADYAEMFEWEDGNPNIEDRVGRFVTLNGSKIHLADDIDEFILGIISGAPTIVGDVYNDQWKDMYLRDVFGRIIWEEIEVPDQTSECGEIISSHIEHRRKVNPNYNHEERYIARSDRPQWGIVGMLGKLIAIDDGTCVVNGWCKPDVGGIATYSSEQTRYRVMERIDNTHIRVLIL